jgi:hypothetical protein
MTTGTGSAAFGTIGMSAALNADAGTAGADTDTGRRSERTRLRWHRSEAKYGHAVVGLVCVDTHTNLGAPSPTTSNA